MSLPQPSDSVKLRIKEESDLPQDHIWSLDPYLMKVNCWTAVRKYNQFLHDYRAECKVYQGFRWRYAIETDTGCHIGNCSVDRINDVTCAIGMYIGEQDDRRHRYGTEALVALIELVRNLLGFKDVIAFIMQDNIPAQLFFTKQGFVFLGISPMDINQRYVYLYTEKATQNG